MKTDQFYGSWYLKVKTNEMWAYLNDVFTSEECDKIITQILEKEDSYNAMISVKGETPSAYAVDENVRKGKVSWVNAQDPENYWIFQRLTDAVNHINQQFWKFDLDYIESLQFTQYLEKGDCYHTHGDALYQSIHYRKLSFSVQLSDPESYEGGDLEFFDGTKYHASKRTKGSFIAFPSYNLHRVTPIETGKRYSLVGWVCGPNFK